MSGSEEGAIVGAAVGGPVGAVVGAVVGGCLVAGAGLVLYLVLDKKDFTRYGDIMKVKTTGASLETARQDGLGYKGVRASETLAETDAGRMERYRSIINSVGQKWEIDPALIAAIISRESRAGNTLDDGWGDYRRAWGLMQVDVDPNGGRHKKRGAWDSEEHLNQATGILVDFINIIKNKSEFKSCTREQVLKGGIAAYNMGDGNVHSYKNVDAKTTGGDYSNDVVARAQWYKNNKNY
ncbi:uncharacterized protein V6R79_013559 [Siganus canaliculatus]